MTAINGQVDPRSLSAHELEALRLVKTNRLIRQRNGYRCMGKVVSLAMFDKLLVRGLVRRELVHGYWRVRLTGAGIYTLGVADERKRA